MNWETCRENHIRERTANPEQARSLRRMAEVRLQDNSRRERTSDTIPLIVETYWEVMKQLITALLNLNGYKSYSQECLISFLREFYDFTESDLQRMDQLRRLRNDVDYRGAFLNRDYLDRNEEQIRELIAVLDNNVDAGLSP